MIKPGGVGRIVIYPGEPQTFVRTNPGTMRELERRMTPVKAGARQRVRVRTGTLLSTIRMNGGVNGRGVYVDVLAGGRGARYVGVEEFGSRPHRIVARRRKFLRFTINGVVVFRRAVNHPGTQGSRFLRDSLILAAG